MWALLIITIVNGGEAPAKFETVNYPTLQACMHARAETERKPGNFGYCSFETKKSQ